VGSADTLLGNRAIARWEAAWGLSALGTWSFAIVLALYAYYEHGPAGVGLAVAARMVPAAVFAGLPALVARRWSSRTAVLGSAVVRFLVLEAVALVASTEAPFALLLALAAAFEIAEGLHRSVRTELILESARAPGDLAALGWSRMVTLAGHLGGALASVVIVFAVSLHAAFAVSGLAFLLVAGIAWRMPITAATPDRVPAAADPQWGGRGIAAIAGQSWRRLGVALTGAAVMAESTLDLLLVVVALDLVHAGDVGVGWLRAAFACGGLLAAGAATAALRGGRVAWGAVAGLALAGIPLVVVAAWPVLATALVLIGLLGAGYALLGSSLQLLTQRLVTARTAADGGPVDEHVTPLARAAGAGLGTWLVLQLGDRAAVVAVGLALPAIAIVALRPLRRAERAIRIPPRALERIGALPLLAHLPVSAIENLALGATVEHFETGDAILNRDQANDRLYVIDSGAVECAAEQGPAIRLEAGSCFGASALLGDDGSRLTATAVTPVTASTITRADFIRCLGGRAPGPGITAPSQVAGQELVTADPTTVPDDGKAAAEARE
jgi:cyclic nucleotide-binding protein